MLYFRAVKDVELRRKDEGEKDEGRRRKAEESFLSVDVEPEYVKRQKTSQETLIQLGCREKVCFCSLLSGRKKKKQLSGGHVAGTRHLLWW